MSSQSSTGTPKSRQRANTSFGFPSWRRNNKTEPGTAASPIQTIPLESLLLSLDPSSVPSPAIARSLVDALSSHTPSPPFSVIIPVITNLCSPRAPPAIQGPGFDAISAYSKSVQSLSTADRLSLFDIVRSTEVSWAQDVWEPRLRALNALFPTSDECAGVEKVILNALMRWLDDACVEVFSQRTSQERPEEKAVDSLSDALASWFKNLDASGRLSDSDVSSVFDYYLRLAESAFSLPQPSQPPTPHKEHSIPSVNTTPSRHRRHPSSASNIPTQIVTQPKPQPRNPALTLMNIFLEFLDARLAYLPPSYLSSILVTLFRILASTLNPLPVVDVPQQPRPAPNDRSAVERRTNATISRLLGGPYATACLIILKRNLQPTIYDGSTVTAPLPIETQIKVTLGAVRTLRLQIRRVLEDRIATYLVSDDNAASATPSGAPGGYALDAYVLSRPWSKEVKTWDEKKISFLLVKSMKAWNALRLDESIASQKEVIFEEIAGLLKDVMQSFEDRRDTSSSASTILADTGAAVGETLYELVNYVRPLRTEGGNPVIIPLGNAVSGTTPLLRVLADLLSRDQITYSALLDPPLHVILLSISSHLLDHDTAQIPRLMFDQKQLEPTCSDWLKNWQLLLFSLLAVHREEVKEVKEKEKGKEASLARNSHGNRPLTRKAITDALKKVFLETIVDFPAYRTKLSRLVFDCWVRLARDENEGEDGEVIWKLLGEEVFRSSSSPSVVAERSEEEEDIAVSEILTEMITVAGSCNCSPIEPYSTSLSVDEGNGLPSDTVPSPSPHTPHIPSNQTSATPSGTVSPVSPKTHDSSTSKEGGSSQIPQFMSLLSFATPTPSSRGQTSVNVTTSQSPDEHPNAATSPSSIQSFSHTDFSPIPSNKDSTAAQCRGVIAVVSLIELFLRLAFDDSVVMSDQQAGLAINIFKKLVGLMRSAKCAKARLIACQALMRLRADRNHKVYFKTEPTEDDPHILALATSIERLRYPFPPLPTTTVTAALLAATAGASTATPTGVSQKVDDKGVEEYSSVLEESRRSRPKQVFERDGRKTSRGRGSGASDSTVSRSRSRAAGHGNRSTPLHMNPMALSTAQAQVKRRGPGWLVPDVLPFSSDKKRDGKESQLIVTFVPSDEDERNVLPVSYLMDTYVEIIKSERDWDILSFVLVHLPSQLANKHYWCGPLTRESINNLLNEICKGIDDGSLGKCILQDDFSYWSGQSKATRDAQMLAFNTLSVLTSYQTIFETSRKQTLVKVFQAGLSGIPATVKCCLHALSLCAFELQVYIAKDLPQILEKLSQIMTNPSMAVHILTFLSTVASQPTLHSSFTENDFKTVFAVALQYLQHHNRPETIAMIPFALAQHVRIISYYVVYVWFLALKLSDRPQHIKFITRQLLLANEGRDEVDAPTEVCFDWLARYTYGSADPKPAASMLDDILSTPAEGEKEHSAATSEVLEQKSWIVGYSIVTVKRLVKPGWLEVTSRRASGTTKFLCRNENVPLVDIGDVNPDMVTVPSILMMDKIPDRSPASRVLPAVILPRNTPVDVERILPDVSDVFSSLQLSEDVPRPHDITGYVWSGSAPSQRRKQVDLDPSFFPLQLSGYPDIRGRAHRGKVVRDQKALASIIRTLDRIPVIDTHKVGILYVAPGQTNEVDILRNAHGSPAYTRFLEGLGRLISLRGQKDVYVGGLDPDEDGEYAYAWWDDIGQLLYHTATLMPNHPNDKNCNYKKRHIGNDLVRIVWNDSGLPYKFDTLTTDFQFVNIVIEPHSRGAIAAYSDDKHENAYFKVVIQQAEGMSEFGPIGDFKIVSAVSLPTLVRQLSLVADWYAAIFKDTDRDTKKEEIITNWRSRLQYIQKFAKTVPDVEVSQFPENDIMGQEQFRDFTPQY